MGPIKAVWRIVHEVDPVFFEDSPPNKRMLFLNNVSHLLIGNGANEFYFNVPVTDEHYQKTLEKHFSCTRTSREPEFRYKMNLI